MMLQFYFVLGTGKASFNISQLLATHSPMHNSLLKLITRSAGGPNLAQSREGKTDSICPSV